MKSMSDTNQQHRAYKRFRDKEQDSKLPLIILRYGLKSAR